MERSQRSFGARTLAPLGLLFLLMATSSTSSARGWMPDEQDTWGGSCYFLPDGARVCQEGAGDTKVWCTGVSMESYSPSATDFHRRDFAGVCTDPTDPTNFGVCEQDAWSQGSRTGDPYAWSYQCVGYWDGCYAWSQSENGAIGSAPQGRQATGMKTSGAGSCPEEWD